MSEPSTAPPKCTLTREYPVAVSIDDAALRRLDAILRGSQLMAGTVTYKAKLADKSELSFEDVEALVAYKNPRGRAITRLRASCIGIDRKTLANFGQISVEIDTVTELTKAVEIDVTGADELVQRFRNRFEEWVEEVEQSRLYSVFARQSSLSFTFGIIVLLVGVGVVALLIASVSRNGLALSHPVVPQPKPKPETETTLLGVALPAALPLLLIFGVPSVLNRLRSRFWPVVVFKIGQGKKRAEELSAGRALWGFGLAIPVILTAVGIAFGFAKC
jgi:hypothetical protein